MTQTTSCTLDHPKDWPCKICNPQTTEPALTKEYILETLEEMIDFPSTHPLSNEEARVLRAIRFVLKNRTVENWGPREMSFGEAMGEAMKEGML